VFSDETFWHKKGKFRKNKEFSGLDYIKIKYVHKWTDRILESPDNQLFKYVFNFAASLPEKKLEVGKVKTSFFYMHHFFGCP
jgi:hypothetical protein